MMRTRLLLLLERCFIGGLILIFGLIVLHAPLTVFAETHIGHPLEVKAWKEILMGALFILAVVIISARRAWHLFARDPLIIASLALALLYIFSLQYGHGFKPYAGGLLIDLRYIMYAILAYVGIKLFPDSRALFLRVGLIGAIVVVGFGLLQFILPNNFLSILGYSKATITPFTTIDSYQGLPRLQSTLRGPNPLGAYAMVVAIIAGIAAVRGSFARRARIGLGVLALAALIVLYASYSRSAYIGLGVGGALAAVIAVGRRRLVSKRAVLIMVAAIVVLGGGLFAIRNTSFYSNVLKHEVAGSGPAVNSDAGHSLSLKDGWHSVITHPFGFGTGSTGSASLLSDNGYIVENQYLYVAHEAGWLAFALFIFISGLLLKRLYARRSDPVALGVLASGIGLFIVGLFLPVFADDTVSIIWFGAAALIAGGYHGKRTTK